MSPERSAYSFFRGILATMRPIQWTKNAFVLVPVFFAWWDRSQSVSLFDGLSAAGPAALLFCIVSSGVYTLNDIADAPSDRNHPEKRFRPVASARLSIAGAWGLALILLAAGCAGAWLLSYRFYVVVSVYVVIQMLYSLYLKRIPMLDVFVISSGFVLRALGGAVVLKDIIISPWLLLCTFLLALFLALCKRRHEKASTGNFGRPQRTSLSGYDIKLLDQLIAITAAAVIVSYAIYTLWPQTVRKFGTSALGLTVPFVVFGVFRYLYLVYRRHRGDKPERLLFTDIPLLADILLYALTVGAVLSFPP
ncbi:MAG: decaprenyl-phosphate phosphoribosyltransferase [Kiritimatiellia bacterium]